MTCIHDDIDDLRTRVATLEARLPVPILAGPPGTASNSSGLVVNRTISPGVGGQIVVLDVVPSAPLIGSLGIDEAVHGRITMNTSKFTQGPTGAAQYFNTVMQWGMNINPNATSFQTAKGVAVRSAIEFRFAQGLPTSNLIAEWHPASMLTPTGQEIRLMSAIASHDPADWHVSPDGSAVFLAGYAHTLADGRMQQRISYEFSDTQANIFYYKGNQPGGLEPQHRCGDTNRAFIQQFNTALSQYLNWPFMNQARGEWYNVRPRFQQATPVTNLWSVPCINTEQVLTPPADYAVRQVVHAAVTSCTGHIEQGQASVRLRARNISNNAGGIVVDRITNTNADVMTVYSTGAGGRTWSVGIDHTKNALVIERVDEALGTTTPHLELTNDRIIAGVPIAHRSYTVAQLGSIPSPQAGDTVWCSNARNTGEGAGAGTGSLVTYSGSLWRIPGVSTAVAA